MKPRSYLNFVLSILVFGGALLGPAAAIASPEIDPSNNPNWKFCEALIVPGNPTIYTQHVSCGKARNIVFDLAEAMEGQSRAGLRWVKIKGTGYRCRYNPGHYLDAFACFKRPNHRILTSL